MGTLLIASVSFAGMGAYACQIINSFTSVDNIQILVDDSGSGFFKSNIKEELQTKVHYISKRNFKFAYYVNLVSEPSCFVNQVKGIMKRFSLTNIHCLTSESMYYRSLIKLNNKFRLIYTVHDLTPHEAQQSLYRKIISGTIQKRIELLRNKIDVLVTNSQNQYDQLRKYYTSKCVYKVNFPSLVNNDIINGSNEVSELRNVEKYILFFGRIEKYKGVDILYDTFLKSRLGEQGYTLVIAGKGNIYFDRNTDKEDKVIFINRYISDTEVKNLFEKAHSVVFPYISATQSGVFSLVCYFNKVAFFSDVPFFKEVLEKNEIATVLDFKDVEDFKNNILNRKSNVELGVLFKNQELFIQTELDSSIIRKQLLEVYSLQD